jgi:large subunit ribosomal protein L2
MSLSNFNYYYKDYKNFLKNNIKKNFKYKPLVKNVLKKTSGRNNKGFITAYHRGGGVKRLYKRICFNYLSPIAKFPCLLYWTVIRIEYDNNRSANVALLQHNIAKLLCIWNNASKNIQKIAKKTLKKNNRFFSYFLNTYYTYKLANEGLKKNDLVSYFTKTSQYFPMENQFAHLKRIKTGSYLFNIELKPCTKGKLVRAAGSKAKLLRKYEKYGVISLPSGEKKLLLLNCFASLGIPSNSLYKFKKDYKAGNSRWKNIRPAVRGVAKNPIDHPHGGGEGKSSGGRHSVSKWGMLTKGYVTKRKKIKKKKRYV